MRRVALALLPLAAPAAAAPIAVTKVATPVSDGVNTLNPRVLPGGVVEYVLTATNPLLNPERIGNVQLCDVLPDAIVLATADLGGAGAGPVQFTQGLIGSGLAYSYVGLDSPADGLTFFDAAGASVVPTAGSDARIRRICVTLTGTRMTGGGSFQLRYRAAVR